MAQPDTYLETQQPAAFDAAQDAGAFDRPYPGNLLDDCASAIDLKAEVLKIHNQFMALHGIAPMGDGKRDDATRETSCGGHFSEMARGGF